MTGPEHYAEAERLVTTADVAAAQVHATLALVAATMDAATLTSSEWADSYGIRRVGAELPGEWCEVLQ
jgi:hypothetical protein